MKKSYSSFSRIAVPAALLLALLVAAAPPVGAQAIIKVNDNVWLKFGGLLQGWADWQGLSDANGGHAGYQQNLFIRRARFLIMGNIAKDVEIFFDTENANLGKSPKNTTGTQLGTGFQLLDFYGSWKLAEEFQIQAGLILIPLCRNCNESAATQASLDYGSWSFQESAATGSTIGRDTGFQVKGYLANGHLEYRAGAYQGARNTGSHNSFRFTGRLMYNFFDVEKTQFYAGTYLNTKKVLAIGAGYDTQSDYKAYAFDAFLNLPLNDKKLGLTFEADYIHYDGGVTFNVANLYKQDTFFTVAALYIASAKIAPFVRYEVQDYQAAANKVLNKRNMQFGMAYYPFGHNLNFKLAWTRQQRPNDPKTATTNEYTLQMQVFYF